MHINFALKVARSGKKLEHVGKDYWLMKSKKALKCKKGWR